MEARQSFPPGPSTPTWQRLPALPPCRFRLYPVRSPLLGASLLFSLPRGTQMFHFPRFPLPALCVQTGMARHDPCQVLPFGNPRIDACLAASRGLSQPATSFIGFQRLGIHRVPFSTCRDDARARYGVLKVRGRTVRRLRDAPRHPPVRWRWRGGRAVHPRSCAGKPTEVGSRALPERCVNRSLQSCTVCPTRQRASPLTVMAASGRVADRCGPPEREMAPRG